jgi:hypothetical protein
MQKRRPAIPKWNIAGLDSFRLKTQPARRPFRNRRAGHAWVERETFLVMPRRPVSARTSMRTTGAAVRSAAGTSTMSSATRSAARTRRRWRRISTRARWRQWTAAICRTTRRVIRRPLRRCRAIRLLSANHRPSQIQRRPRSVVYRVSGTAAVRLSRLFPIHWRLIRRPIKPLPSAGIR